MKTRNALLSMVVVAALATVSSADIITAQHMKDVWWGHGDGTVYAVSGASIYDFGEAVGVLEAALGKYYWRGFDVYELSALMDELTGLAREIAFTFVNEKIIAVAAGGDADLIDEALLALEVGDQFWRAGAYSEAVEMYQVATQVRNRVLEIRSTD